MKAARTWFWDRMVALRRQPMLAGVGAVLLVCICAAVLSIITYLRERALEEAERDLKNLSYVLLEQTDRSFQSISVVTGGAVEYLEGLRPKTVEEFEALASNPRIRFLLLDRIAGLQHIDNLSITSARGRLVNRSRFGPLPNIDLSGREYLQRARNAAPGELIVSGPDRSVTTGRWSIFLSKQVRSSDGELLGVVSAVLELANLQALYSNVVLGPHGSISIVRRDGVLLVRYPEIAALYGKQVGGRGAVSKFVVSGGDGLLRIVSPTDGQERLTSTHSSRQFPISLLVTSTLEDALRAWHEDCLMLVVGGILACLGVSIFTLLVAGATEELANARSAILVGRERERAQHAERVQAQELAHLARHDSLTGLPNRLYFKEELSSRLSTLAEDHGIALHYLDLDRFKGVNDTLGHPTGDALLVEVCKRLRSVIRPSDFIARLGGDEFAIIQTAERGLPNWERLATRVVDSMSSSFLIEQHALSIGTTVGVAISAGLQTSADELVRKADLALYAAKAQGRGLFALFDSEMENQLRLRVSTEQSLRDAIDQNQFELFYQPEVDLCTGRIISLEALIRWRHPSRGLVMPGEFIGIAEEAGLIDKVGGWVVKTAFRDAATWPNSVRLAVNISAAQFRGGDLVSDVQHELLVSGLAPQRLEIEITESLILSHSPENQNTLRRLRSIGCSVCMDDFGTGHSSLTSLIAFPFDRLKVDRSFVSAMSTRPEALAVVRSAASLAKSLGIRTTAEGIETPQQMIQAREEGCNDGQGYFISEPVPASQVPALLQAFEKRRISMVR